MAKAPRKTPVKTDGDLAQTEQRHQSIIRIVQESAKAAADQAAQFTVEKIFLTLGFDISEPEELLKLQRALSFAVDLSNTMKLIRRKAITTTVGLGITGVAALLLIGARAWLKFPFSLPWGGAPMVAIAMLLATPTAAHSRWKPEYASAPPEVRNWYEQAELTPAAEARLHFKSCCAHSDVVRTEFRVNKTDGGDEWYWLDGETWKRVPVDIIHFDSHAPDGRPTLFVLPGTSIETCFYPGDGGI